MYLDAYTCIAIAITSADCQLYTVTSAYQYDLTMHRSRRRLLTIIKYLIRQFLT